MDVLKELRSGRRDSLDRLMPVVYAQLRVTASRQLTLRQGGGTLSTTELVHEAYLKLVDQVNVRTVQRNWAKAQMLLRRALAP